MWLISLFKLISRMLLVLTHYLTFGMMNGLLLRCRLNQSSTYNTSHWLVNSWRRWWSFESTFHKLFMILKFVWSWIMYADRAIACSILCQLAVCSKLFLLFIVRFHWMVLSCMWLYHSWAISTPIASLSNFLMQVTVWQLTNVHDLLFHSILRLTMDTVKTSISWYCWCLVLWDVH